jgi:hypothetical protein
MNMREEILKEHSKAQALLISNYVGNNPDRFRSLVELFFDEEVRVVQRAAWVISHCADNFPDIVVPYLAKFIEYAGNGPPHVAVKRNILRVMQKCRIPEDLEGPAYDLCWNFSNSAKEDIAVRAFSLRILYRIAEKHPELCDEVLSVVEGYTASESKGLVSSARDVASKLNKMKKLKNP